MEELATYLRLTPEFGGTRFGPFETIEVRLGSDPENCHIVLQAELGVQPDHVKLLRQGPNNLILAPSSRTSTVFLWKKGANRPSQLTTPTAVTPGDAFSLVTAEGPRFIIELDELPEEIKAQREKSKPKTGRGRLSKDAFATEGKRQIWTRLLILGPAQLAQRAWLYVKSGAIFMPRNMIIMGMIASGWIFGGASSCKGKKTQSMLDKSELKVGECETSLGFANDINENSEESTFPQLASKILRSSKVGVTLNEDDGLRNEVRRYAKAMFREGVATKSQYQWLVRGKAKRARDFARWRKRVMDLEKIDLETRKLVVWLGVEMGKRTVSEFRKRSDSEENKVCTRGPLNMTYRQAVSLGLSARPDGFVARNPKKYSNDKQAREELLESTIMATGGEGLPEQGTFETTVSSLEQGGAACVYIKGDDDRAELNSLIAMVRKNFSDGATGVPSGSDNRAPVARIAKFWAADMMDVDYTKEPPGIDFSSAQLSTVLDTEGGRGAWVLKRTAQTIARAIVLPCLAALDPEAEAAEATFGNELPQPIPCLIMDWKLRADG